jgi:hypothetical protein
MKQEKCEICGRVMEEIDIVIFSLTKRETQKKMGTDREICVWCALKIQRFVCELHSV